MIFYHIIGLIISLSVLIWGADKFIDNSSLVAKKLGLSELTIGLTIVALGTSAPEIFVAISSVINSAEAVAIGTIVGSNITNIALIFGVSCFAINQIKKRFSLESLIPSLLSFLLFLYALKDLRFSLIESLGFILILFYFLVILSKERSNVIQVVSDNSDMLKNFIMLLVGLVLLVVGSNFAVIYAEKFALSIGISEVIVGLTILALGTSLPELAATVSAIFKGKNQMVIGNIIGSNILNLVIIVPIIVDFGIFFLGFDILSAGIEADSIPRKAKNVKVVVIVIALKFVSEDRLIGKKLFISKK